MESHNGEADDLPPPPPLAAGVEPLKADETKMPLKPRSLVQRNGFGRKGQQIKLITNHFKVSLMKAEDFFYHYYVNLKYEDDTPVDRKGSGRKVIEKLQQTYAAELANKDFAYDGEKSLFTIGALPQVKMEFTVVDEDVSTGKTPANGSPGNDSPPGSDRKRVRRPYNTKTYKVELSFAAKIPMSAISQALRGQESEHTQEAIRVIDIILRQHSAKQGCLLVRQSFFHNNPSNFVDLGGGVVGCRGFHSSFRATQSGLSLNIDVSTTMIVKPGPVIDFLIANQKVNDPSMIDWAKFCNLFTSAQAKRSLKNLRIKTSPANQEQKIVGLSDRPCREQLFTLKHKNGESEEITVFDYFVKNRGIKLEYSGDLPCINVGKPKRPTYFPVELCSLLPLQRYTKALSTLQRSSLVEKSRQKPQERMSVLSDVLQRSNYDAEPMLKACGITIARNFIEVDGRVLQPPKLKAGNGEDIFTRNGRWNFNNKKLIRASSVEKWAVVNFSARCNVRDLVRDLIKCGGMKGIMVDAPFAVFDENPSMRRSPAVRRVEDMFEQVKTKLPGAPKFLLCVLAERKNSDIYGPWKKKCLAEFGIVTQCVAPTRVNDQYLTNVLLKINAKLGGLNSLLQIETSPAIPLVSKVPTIILGMDVSHGSPGHSDIPSVAAVSIFLSFSVINNK
ncbi:argonaute4a [Zea mays]|uniref:Argonaute4a n=1 Tax=Zea mays TaxID=4577 RepID=A0A1D6FB95_MAIZE|nr:argonaute4a [Zea mays]